MDEYYGLYGKANAEPANQTEGKPLQQLSEKDISNQIDNELSADKEACDLEWSFYFEFIIFIKMEEEKENVCEVCCQQPEQKDIVRLKCQHIFCSKCLK